MTILPISGKGGLKKETKAHKCMPIVDIAQRMSSSPALAYLDLPHDPQTDVIGPRRSTEIAN